MKTILFRLGLISLLLGCQLAGAQSIANLYNGENQNGYSIDALPGTTRFVAAGTYYDASGNHSLHLVEYLNDGTTWRPYDIDDPNFDDRSVKVIALDSSRVAVICYAQQLGAAVQGQVRILIFNLTFSTIVAQQRYALPATSTFPSLYPLDAIWDQANNCFAICGTAVNGDASVLGTQKQAFVLTVNATTLAPILLAKYQNSTTGNFGIATRIKKTLAGRYYVTGSENLNKSTAALVMGVRNMLITPATLNGVFVPLRISSAISVSENGVDMYETGTATSGNFCILVNSTLGFWGVVRVNKSTLMPVTGLFERNPNPGVAYEYMPGNTSAASDAVVAGMHAISSNSVMPFNSFLNLAPTPGLVTSELEYNTIIGNAGFTTMGNFYAENNTYPLPSFLHRFAWRENGAINRPIAIIAPITNTAGPWLNSKFIPAAPSGTVVCPFTNLTGGLNNTFQVSPTGTVTPTFFQLSPSTSALSFVRLFPTPTPNCLPSGGNYYKLGLNYGSNESLVYPNPTQGTIYLNLSSYGNATVSAQLFDLTGKHIATVYEGSGQEKIEYQLPSDIAKGLYLLSIEANGKDKRIEKISIE